MLNIKHWLLVSNYSLPILRWGAGKGTVSALASFLSCCNDPSIQQPTKKCPLLESINFRKCCFKRASSLWYSSKTNKFFWADFMQRLERRARSSPDLILVKVPNDRWSPFGLWSYKEIVTFLPSWGCNCSVTFLPSWGCGCSKKVVSAAWEVAVTCWGKTREGEPSGDVSYFPV